MSHPFKKSHGFDACVISTSMKLVSVIILSHSAMIIETVRKMAFHFPARPGSFPAVGYQTLAFIQVAGKPKGCEKIDRSDIPWKNQGMEQLKIH